MYVFNPGYILDMFNCWYHSNLIYEMPMACSMGVWVCVCGCGGGGGVCVSHWYMVFHEQSAVTNYKKELLLWNHIITDVHHKTTNDQMQCFLTSARLQLNLRQSEKLYAQLFYMHISNRDFIFHFYFWD
jgi:hypothetical protein